MGGRTLEPGFADEEYPADPYPGARPAASFLHHEQKGYPLTSGGRGTWEWRVGDQEGRSLDEHLAAAGSDPIAERLPVLAYGSNANPSKITWLRDHLGLSGPVIVLRARCHDVAAVWSAGVRKRDGQRPAVLAAMRGTAEEHAVWLVTPEQRRVLDRGEGRGERYRLAWVHTDVDLEGGQAFPSVLAYTARPEALGEDVPLHLNRSPLLVDGALVRCSELGQADALRLEGVPAESDGLVVTEVRGEPALPSELGG